jgi:predicted DNA binding protein
MSEGVRAELEVNVPQQCPLAALSDETADITGVSWAVGDDGITEEFRTTSTTAPATVDGVDAVFDVGDERVFRYQRDEKPDCACRIVEGLGFPVADVLIRDGTLVMTLHLDGVEELREVVRNLQEIAERVQVSYLVREGIDDDDHRKTSIVDVGALTERQIEVLETAYDMGYFEHPRGANATEVANALDITLTTFTQHLAVAQSKLLSGILQ